MSDDVIRVGGKDYALVFMGAWHDDGETVDLRVRPKRKQTKAWCAHWCTPSCDTSSCPDIFKERCFVIIEDGKVVE